MLIFEVFLFDWLMFFFLNYLHYWIRIVLWTEDNKWEHRYLYNIWMFEKDSLFENEIAPTKRKKKYISGKFVNYEQ